MQLSECFPGYSLIILLRASLLPVIHFIICGKGGVMIGGVLVNGFMANTYLIFEFFFFWGAEGGEHLRFLLSNKYSI